MFAGQDENKDNFACPQTRASNLTDFLADISLDTIAELSEHESARILEIEKEGSRGSRAFAERKPFPKWGGVETGEVDPVFGAKPQF